MRYLGCLALLGLLLPFSNVKAADATECFDYSSICDNKFRREKPSFGSFYTNSTAVIAPDSIIPMAASQNNSSDVTLETGYIVIKHEGYYFVNFGASQAVGGLPIQAALFLNGNLISLSASVNSNPAPAGLMTSSAIIWVDAGDELTLVNISSTDSLNLGNGNPNIPNAPTAFITLVKIT